MTLRAKRPLDPDIVKKADDDFYAQNPSMAPNGVRTPITPIANDPCSELFSKKWLAAYQKHGGEVESGPAMPSCLPGATTIPCSAAAPAPAVTEKEATALFKQLAENKNIPFDYPVDCCYSRAHAMCGMLKANGIACEKYWLYNKHFATPASSSDLAPVKADGKPVTFPNEKGVPQQVKWVYHVAPLLEVTKADGSTEKMVIDPSIADRPLSMAEWRQIQGDPAGAIGKSSSSDVYFKGPAGEGEHGDPDFSAACSKMEEHKDRRDTNRAKMSAGLK